MPSDAAWLGLRTESNLNPSDNNNQIPVDFSRVRISLSVV